MDKTKQCRPSARCRGHIFIDGNLFNGAGFTRVILQNSLNGLGFSTTDGMREFFGQNQKGSRQRVGDVAPPQKVDDSVGVCGCVSQGQVVTNDGKLE